MKYLNNTNGEQLVISKVRFPENTIILSKKEFGGGNVIGTVVQKVEENIINYETQEVKSFDELYNLLEIENYEVSEDAQNWVITQGISEPTTVRVYLPSALLNKHLGSGDALDQLITAMLPLKDFKQVLENGTLQYLGHLDDEAKAILETFEEIIIEYKN